MRLHNHPLNSGVGAPAMGWHRLWRGWRCAVRLPSGGCPKAEVRRLRLAADARCVMGCCPVMALRGLPCPVMAAKGSHGVQ